MLCRVTVPKASTRRTIITAAASSTRAVHRSAIPLPASPVTVLNERKNMTGSPTTAAISTRRTARRGIDALRRASSTATVNSTTCTASIQCLVMNADSR